MPALHMASLPLSRLSVFSATHGCADQQGLCGREEEASKARRAERSQPRVPATQARRAAGRGEGCGGGLTFIRFARRKGHTYFAFLVSLGGFSFFPRPLLKQFSSRQRLTLGVTTVERSLRVHVQCASHSPWPTRQMAPCSRISPRPCHQGRWLPYAPASGQLFSMLFASLRVRCPHLRALLHELDGVVTAADEKGCPPHTDHRSKRSPSPATSRCLSLLRLGEQSASEFCAGRLEGAPDTKATW